MIYRISTFAALFGAIALFSTVAVTGPTLADPQAAEVAPLLVDISPMHAEPLEYDSSAYRGPDEASEAPLTAEAPLAPENNTDSPENGDIQPNIVAGSSGAGAGETSVEISQRIDLGPEQPPEEQATIQPYLELGADVENLDDSSVFSRNRPGSNVYASIGAGSRVRVNDRVEFHLGYTRREPVSGLSLEAKEEEDRVESGVTIRF